MAKILRAGAGWSSRGFRHVQAYRLRLMEVTPMMLPPYKGLNVRNEAKVTEEARYQTLFIDEFLNDESRQVYIRANSTTSR